MENNKFSLGHVVATPGALDALTENETFTPYILRHVRGDWGDLSEGDKMANEDALSNEARILSAYKLKNGTKIWIITEADRSSTCVLLPGDY